MIMHNVSWTFFLSINCSATIFRIATQIILPITRQQQKHYKMVWGMFEVTNNVVHCFVDFELPLFLTLNLFHTFAGKPLIFNRNIFQAVLVYLRSALKILWCSWRSTLKLRFSFWLNVWLAIMMLTHFHEHY